jgi:hypothetical protein
MNSAHDERITMNEQHENYLFYTYYNYYMERNERFNDMIERINSSYEDSERLTNLLRRELLREIEVPVIERIEFQLPRIELNLEEQEQQIDEFLTLRTEEMMEAELCSICLENVSYGCRLNCQHCFHSNCIKRWLIKTNTCPMCRSVVV